LAGFSKGRFLAGNSSLFATQPPLWEIAASKSQQK
jgi:hypothetical protein